MMKSQIPNPKTQIPIGNTLMSLRRRVDRGASGQRPGFAAFVRPRVGFGLWALGFGLCLSVSVPFTGCAKAKAKTIAEGPALQVPEPPPRVLTPVEEPIAATPATPESTPPAPAPRTAPPRPATPPRRPNTAANEPTPRQETPPPVEQPVAAPAPSPTSAEPPRELRPALSAADTAEERKVRDLLTRAARDLNRIDYRRLSADGRAQYEQSKRFSDQADQAIKDRNYVFAATLADKAATLAAQLLGR
jgi:hypothetical protein